MPDPQYMNPTQLFPGTGNPMRSSPVSPDRCITEYEREAAVALCLRKKEVIAGLGAAGYADYANTRWAALDPCDVQNFPICHTDCNDANEAELIQGCLVGAPPPSFPPFSDPSTREFHFDNWCNQAGAGLIENDTCPGEPVPPCILPEHVGLVDYCEANGYSGPDGGLNSICYRWISSGIMPQVSAAPVCGEGPAPAPPLPAVPGVEVPGGRKTLTIGGLLLLLVIGGSAAYYVSQRKGT